jgi:tetratricopeptide (TPR) repeat protein
MNIRLGSIALLLFIPIQLVAADKWTSVHSTNFTLVGSATEAQLRTVGIELEQFRDAFTQTLGLPARPASIPTTVLVLKNPESLRTFNLGGTAGQPGSAGFFQASEDVNYMAVVAGAPISRTVYHQYAHELMRDLPNAIPLWFSEGLADFFSNFEIVAKDKQFAVGKTIPEHLDVLRKGLLMPFEELFKVDRSSPLYNEREMTGMFHAESWALVNYLMVGISSTRQAQVNEFVKSLVSGKPAAESFRTAFKSDVASMQKEIETYLGGKGPAQGRGTALKDRAIIEKEMKVRALSDAEAEFYSGDLLVHFNNLQDAAPHLQQAMKLDAKLAAAQASMGMLFLKEDRLSEAIDNLKHAVDADPNNYLSQYHYAYVLDKNSTSPLDDLDAKRAALGKAIELMPQFAAAYELLAYINLTADIDYDTTIDLLRTANKYAPANPNVRFLFAQALVKKKEFDQAEKTLQALQLDTTLDSSTRDNVRNLANYISRTREAQNAQVTEDAANSRREDEAARQAAEKRLADHTVDTSTVAQPAGSGTAARPKSGELIAVTPQRVRPQGTQIKGALTLVDCRNGLTLTIKTDAETLVLHTDTPDKIEFVSFTSSVNSSISCGPTRGNGIRVLVTYRPTPGAATAGEPLVVEFVEQ